MTRINGGSRIGVALGIVTAVVALDACVRQRDIFAPIPGAVEVTVNDTSISTAVEAASRAITDRGIGIALVDEEHGMVESEYIDITALRTDIDPAFAGGIERNVRFRFRALPSFGAISIYGEAVYRLGEVEGLANERMVPQDHPARPILAEMLESIQDRMAAAKAEREPPPPGR
jgi:hypothetical protein